MLPSTPNKYIALARKLFSTLFSFSLVLYLVLFLVENVVPGFVSEVYPVTYFLYPVLFFGILSSIFPQIEVEQKIEVIKWTDFALATILSIAGAALIWYKVDLASPLREGIAALSGLLILLTSVLVILPEDYAWQMPHIQKRYYWLVLILVSAAILGYGKYRQDQIISTPTIVRLAPSAYSIELFNHSGNDTYTKSYTKLLTQNGYTKVVSNGEDKYPDITTTTIMYAIGDSVAGEEVAGILRQSYGAVQTMPLASEDHTIIVILGVGESQ